MLVPEADSSFRKVELFEPRLALALKILRTARLTNSLACVFSFRGGAAPHTHLVLAGHHLLPSGNATVPFNMGLSLPALDRPQITAISKPALCPPGLRQHHNRCTPHRRAPRCSSSSDNGRTAEASEQQSRDQQPSQTSQPPRIPQGLSYNPATPPEQEGDAGVIELRRETFAGRVAILTLGVCTC